MLVSIAFMAIPLCKSRCLERCASSHQGELPRASQDHGIACDAEKVELAVKLLFLANAIHAAPVPFRAIIGISPIDFLLHVEGGHDAFLATSVHAELREMYPQHEQIPVRSG